MKVKVVAPLDREGVILHFVAEIILEEGLEGICLSVSGVLHLAHFSLSCYFVHIGFIYPLYSPQFILFSASLRDVLGREGKEISVDKWV